MTPESQYVRAARLRAGRHLPADFARQVLRDARLHRQRAQRNKLAAITVAICVALVVATHWAMTAGTNRRNLAMWSKAVAQVATLEETI
jgi:hypothetical protein